MKIAFFVNDFPATSETFIINQIVGLLQRGHHVDIYARNIVEPVRLVLHADIADYHLLARTQVYTLPRHWLLRTLNAVRLLVRWGWRQPKIALDSLNVVRHRRFAANFRILHELFPPLWSAQQYDVIHAHFGPNGRLALRWRDFGALRGPIVTTFHGYDVNLLPRSEGGDLYRDLFARGDLFTVGSEYMRKRILSLGAPAGRIVKLPMGVDLGRLDLAVRPGDRAGGPRLLTVARLVEVKGIEYAIRAVALLKRKYPTVLHTIVGDGPLRGELEALAGELDLAENVKFAGALPQERIIGFYREADIFVLPGIVTGSGEEEGQSLVLAEAQATGLPIVATRVGGVPESMRDGETGLLVPPRDPAGLASAIERLAADPLTLARMGRSGRAYVERRFDLKKLNDELVDLYGSMLPGLK